MTVLPWLVFIITSDCLLCGVRAEAAEQIYDPYITIEHVRYLVVGEISILLQCNQLLRYGGNA